MKILIFQKHKLLYAQISDDIKKNQYRKNQMFKGYIYF